jgi:hypothetical protein
MPEDVLIPVLGYPSVSEAAAWLTRAFGFSVRWRVEEHRAQLGVGLTSHHGGSGTRDHRPRDGPSRGRGHTPCPSDGGRGERQRSR